MNKIFLFLTAIISSINLLFAQDDSWSQPYSNPFSMCPALVGNAGDPRISSSLNTSWSDKKTGYLNGILGFDSEVKPIHGGLGIYGLYSRDQGLGTFVHWSVNGIYSYSKKVGNHFLIRGASQFSFAHKMDEFVDMFSLASTGRYDMNYFDLGLSVASEWRKFTIGFSCLHVNSPDLGLYQMNKRFSFMFGYDLWLMKGEKPEGFHFSPLLYYTASGDENSFMVGGNIFRDGFFGGLFLNLPNIDCTVAVVSLGFQTNQFQMGYSYDLPLSDRFYQSNGKHEVFLNYLFNKNNIK